MAWEAEIGGKSTLACRPFGVELTEPLRVHPNAARLSCPDAARSATKQAKGTLVVACGLGTGVTHATAATRGPVKRCALSPVSGVLPPAVDRCSDVRPVHPAKAPRSLLVRDLVAPTKPVLAGRHHTFRQLLVFEERGLTRMRSPGMRALRARYEPHAGGGRSDSGGISKTRPKSIPQRAMKEQRLPITSEPFRACQCFLAGGHSHPFCAR